MILQQQPVGLQMKNGDSFQDESGSSSKGRILYCRKCEGHGFQRTLKGHGPLCPYIDCNCKSCDRLMRMRKNAFVRRYKDNLENDDHVKVEVVKSNQTAHPRHRIVRTVPGDEGGQSDEEFELSKYIVEEGTTNSSNQPMIIVDSGISMTTTSVPSSSAIIITSDSSNLSTTSNQIMKMLDETKLRSPEVETVGELSERVMKRSISECGDNGPSPKKSAPITVTSQPILSSQPIVAQQFTSQPMFLPAGTVLQQQALPAGLQPIVINSSQIAGPSNGLTQIIGQPTMISSGIPGQNIIFVPQLQPAQAQAIINPMRPTFQQQTNTQVTFSEQNSISSTAQPQYRTFAANQIPSTMVTVSPSITSHPTSVSQQSSPRAQSLPTEVQGPNEPAFVAFLDQVLQMERFLQTKFDAQLRSQDAKQKSNQNHSV